MNTLEDICARMAAKEEEIRTLRDAAAPSTPAWHSADAVRLLASAVRRLVDSLGTEPEPEVVEAAFHLESAQAAAYVAAMKHFIGPRVFVGTA